MPRPAPHRAPAARTEHLVQRYLCSAPFCSALDQRPAGRLAARYLARTGRAHLGGWRWLLGSSRPDVPYRDDCAVRRRGVDRSVPGGVWFGLRRAGAGLQKSLAVGARSPTNPQRCPTSRRSPGSPAHRSSPSTGRSLEVATGRPVYGRRLAISNRAAFAITISGATSGLRRARMPLAQGVITVQHLAVQHLFRAQRRCGQIGQRTLAPLCNGREQLGAITPHIARA